MLANSERIFTIFDQLVLSPVRLQNEGPELSFGPCKGDKQKN